MESISKRTAKDTVFKSLFSEPKYLLQLYQALHPEDTETTEDDLTIITLQNILMNGIYNDLGFLAGDRLIVLVESQSTWSANIVVRGLMYLMSSYQEYFNSRDVNLYGTKKIHLPRPEMYVVYTKERGDKPEILNLNDIFFPECPCCIDADVKVIYLDDSDTIINQYIKFCMVLDDEVKKHGRTLTAVKNTLRICRDENLLNEYLRTRETEVEGIMLTLFDQDKVTAIREKEVKAEGIAEGLAKGAIQTYRDLLRAGAITLEQIRSLGTLTPSQLAALENY